MGFGFREILAPATFGIHNFGCGSDFGLAFGVRIWDLSGVWCSYLGFIWCLVFVFRVLLVFGVRIRGLSGVWYSY